jgi:hypothetical protein
MVKFGIKESALKNCWANSVLFLIGPVLPVGTRQSLNGTLSLF